MGDKLTLEQQRAIAVASARVRARSRADSDKQAPSPSDPVKEWRAGHPIEAGAVDFIQGAGGLAKGVLNLLTPSTDGKNKGWGDLLDNPVQDENSGMSLAGKIADPAAWAIGGGISKVLPYAKVLGKGTGNALRALTKNAASGAATGAAIGGLDDGAGAGEGAAVGAVANTLLPPAIGGLVRGARGLKRIVRPSAGQLAARAAGDKTDDVIRALETSKAAVPGTRLTAGQAAVEAGSPEFSALQRRAAQADPDRYSGLGGVEGQQQAARAAHMGIVARTSNKLRSVAQRRTSASDKAYNDAFSVSVKADPALVKLSSNPFFKQAMPDARKLAAAKGITPDKNLTEFLHFVKLSLDDALSKGKAGATAIGKNEQRAIKDVQAQLVAWLEKKNPLYEAARAQHARMSGRIKEMEVGQLLQKAAQGHAGAENPRGLMRALRVAESKRGAGGKTPMEALRPHQRKIFGNVEADLTRDATMKRLASAGVKSMEDRIGAVTAPPPGIFSPVISAARSWFNTATGRMTDRGIKELAEVMANDPAKLAKMMREFSPSQRTQIMNHIYKRTSTAVGGLVSGAD